MTEVPGEGSGAAFGELELERYLVDNSGRIDVAWGATVIELRSDLLREERDVVARMPDDLAPAALRAGESPAASACQTTCTLPASGA
ncbi:MAG: hypothetical protein ACK5WW_03455 [Brevundimonas sp.]|uniref:hypothetical protein n=1 Tax=Brevundimonas sp. TaxID=1871086 RepID=UPI003919E641